MKITTLLIQHIDALIMIVGGLFACFYGYRPLRPGRVPTQNQQWTTKILRVCGPLVVLFGLLFIFINQPGTPTWQRHPTSDGFASAEFPATPQAKQQTDTLNGVSAQRTSLTYNVPSKDISMLLSFSPIPLAELNMTDADRLTAMKAYFVQQNFTVIRESPMQFGASSGFALDLQSDGGKTRVWTRLAIVGSKVYRVVVSSTGAYHDDPIIRRYLDSFLIQ